MRAHNEMRLDFENVFEENLERLESIIPVLHA